MDLRVEKGTKELTFDSFKEIANRTDNVGVRLKGGEIEVYKRGSFRGRLLCWIQRKSIRKKESKEILEKFVDVVRSEYKNKYGEIIGDLASLVIKRSKVYKKNLRLTSSRIKDLLEKVDNVFRSSIVDAQEARSIVDTVTKLGPLKKDVYNAMWFLPSKAMAEIFSNSNSFVFQEAFSDVINKFREKPPKELEDLFTSLREPYDPFKSFVDTVINGIVKNIPNDLNALKETVKRFEHEFLGTIDYLGEKFDPRIDLTNLKLESLQNRIKLDIEITGRKNNNYVSPDLAREITYKNMEEFMISTIKFAKYESLLSDYIKGDFNETRLKWQVKSILEDVFLATDKSKFLRAENVKDFLDDYYFCLYPDNIQRDSKIKETTLNSLKLMLNNLPEDSEAAVNTLGRGDNVYSRLTGKYLKADLNNLTNNIYQEIKNYWNATGKYESDRSKNLSAMISIIMDNVTQIAKTPNQTSNRLKDFLGQIKKESLNFKDKIGQKGVYIILQDVLFLRGINANLGDLTVNEQDAQLKDLMRQSRKIIQLITNFSNEKKVTETVKRYGLPESFVNFILNNEDAIRQFFDQLS